MTLAVFIFFSNAVDARDIHYDALSNAELIACDRLQWRGRIEDSRQCYSELIRATDSLPVLAEAAWALNDLKAANNYFRQAVRADADDVATLVRWGDLYADSHQNAEAMNIYREALQQDEDHEYARLGAARVLAGSFDDAASEFISPLLDNPHTGDGPRLGALLLSSRIALENGNYAEADGALDEATEIVERNEWPPLEIYGLRAALDLLLNVDGSRWTELSLDYNPHYGDIYAVPAHFYVITRRYREAIELYQKAVDIDPGLASAHEELGVNLLRDNQVSRARRHLVTAYELDPFSPVAVNTLRLLDSFENFRLVNDPEVPGTSDLAPLTLRLHKSEADAIAPYAIDLARRSIEEFTQRYGFELSEPVIIEMYPDHEDFAVRTAGMPGLGILGATFGYVVAMDSPSSRPTHEFQWGTTLWHEMAHVFTLEATEHLVPRWFSEGISVFEEWHSGPNPGVRIPMSVYAAISDDRLLPIADLDEGFLRPTYQGQVVVSYMQAGLICQFIESAYGSDRLRALLYKYRDGMQTPEAIEAVLGISAREFDREFDRFVRAQHGRIVDNLDDWQQTRELIEARMADSKWHDVIELAGHMLELLPGYVEADSPYLALAQAHDELGQRSQAISVLETFWRNGGYDPAALKRLAGWLREDSRADAAIDVLQSVNLVDPLDRELHGMLGDMLLEAGRAEEALREFAVALSLDPHDMATANFRMASAYHRLGDAQKTQDYLLQALDIAPNYRPAQKLLLDVMRAGIDTQN
ncbi:MAG: tetratricopeptide repeat protein [Woeseiaceae bacterium]|nr:tetratricopeptide repeat protein [Woeseiaceae bacterium]